MRFLIGIHLKSNFLATTPPVIVISPMGGFLNPHNPQQFPVRENNPPNSSSPRHRNYRGIVSDYPEKYARFGATVCELAKSGMDNLYRFKFSQIEVPEATYGVKKLQRQRIFQQHSHHGGYVGLEHSGQQPRASGGSQGEPPRQRAHLGKRDC